MTTLDFEQRPEYPQWVADKLKINREYFGKCSTIAIWNDKKICAIAVYSSFNGINIEFTIAAASKWWIRKDIMRLLMKYAFEQLGCRRITSLVRKDNELVINLSKKVGFQIEGCLREFYPDRTDCLVFGMLNTERIG